MGTFASITFAIFVGCLVGGILACIIGMPIWALRRLVRAAGRSQQRRELERHLGDLDRTIQNSEPGSPVVAADLDPATMATLIHDLRRRGYAVWPTGPDSFTAMPPQDEPWPPPDEPWPPPDRLDA